MPNTPTRFLHVVPCAPSGKPLLIHGQRSKPLLLRNREHHLARKGACSRQTLTLAIANFALPLRLFAPERLLKELNRQYLVECDGRVGHWVHHVPRSLLLSLPAAGGFPLQTTSGRDDNRPQDERRGERAFCKRVEASKGRSSTKLLCKTFEVSP